jgi:hypothetical protein
MRLFGHVWFVVKFGTPQKRRPLKKAEPLNETTVRPLRLPFVVYLILAFSAGAVPAGVLAHRQGYDAIRELAAKYSGELRSVAETIGRLTEELERERGINQGLREHNNRAGELVEGLTGPALRNVRNYRKQPALWRSTKEAQGWGNNFFPNHFTNYFGGAFYGWLPQTHELSPPVAASGPPAKGTATGRPLFLNQAPIQPQANRTVITPQSCLPRRKKHAANIGSLMGSAHGRVRPLSTS